MSIIPDWVYLAVGALLILIALLDASIDTYPTPRPVDFRAKVRVGVPMFMGSFILITVLLGSG